jgi:hypothetical protein
MAKTDLAAFLGTLQQAEDEMTALFDKLAHDVGDLVLRAAGPDGKVPVERLPQLRAQVGRLVDAAFLGGPDRRPFSEEGNTPLAPFPAIISRGQLAMIDRALDRTAKSLDRLPGDVRQQLQQRQVTR